MKPNQVVITSLSIFIVLSAALLVGCGEIKLESSWRDRKIIIDGKDDEWRNTKTYVKKVKVAIGLYNDENYMYISLTPWDQIIQTQIMRAGFTIWFDPDGGQEKIFGIHYPLGMKDIDLPMRIHSNRKDSEESLRIFAESQKEMEILVPDKDEKLKMSVIIASTQGIEVMVGNSSGRFFYELKVPLTKNEQHPYAIGVGKKKSISIGFETEEFDRESIRKKRDGDTIPQGTGSRSRAPRGAGGRPPGGFGIPERFQLWANVTVAARPSISD